MNGNDDDSETKLNKDAAECFNLKKQKMLRAEEQNQVYAMATLQVAGAYKGAEYRAFSAASSFHSFDVSTAIFQVPSKYELQVGGIIQALTEDQFVRRVKSDPRTPAMHRRSPISGPCVRVWR